MRFLALGEFDLSRNFLVTLAKQGHEVAYGYLGKPRIPEAQAGLDVMPIPRRGRMETVRDLIDSVRPDVLYVGSAGYDASNALAAELLEANPGLPIIRVYKEFPLQPAEREGQVLTGADGVVLHSESVAGYFHALYGLERDRIHLFDHDVIADHLIPDTLTTSKLSASDGEPHVVLGGTMKDDGSCYDYRDFITALAEHRVHVHVYPAAYSRWLAPGRVLDPDSARVRDAYAPVWEHPYVHVEQPVEQSRQIVTWSQYDLGIMQVKPRVYEPLITPWQHMDHPSKHSYYLAAGLPIAIDRTVLTSLREHLSADGVTVEYSSVAELASRVWDCSAMRELGDWVGSRRRRFGLEQGLPALLSFVERVRTSYAKGDNKA